MNGSTSIERVHFLVELARVRAFDFAGMLIWNTLEDSFGKAKAVQREVQTFTCIGSMNQVFK